MIPAVSGNVARLSFCFKNYRCVKCKFSLSKAAEFARATVVNPSAPYTVVVDPKAAPQLAFPSKIIYWEWTAVTPQLPASGPPPRWPTTGASFCCGLVKSTIFVFGLMADSLSVLCTY